MLNACFNVVGLKCMGDEVVQKLWESGPIVQLSDLVDPTVDDFELVLLVYLSTNILYVMFCTNIS